jgi:hypothetical protein
MNQKTEYTLVGIGKPTTVDSVVAIWIGEDGKITRVEDRWNGKLPEGAFTDVGILSKSLLTLQALRKLNAVTVPLFVSPPEAPNETK